MVVDEAGNAMLREGLAGLINIREISLIALPHDHVHNLQQRGYVIDAWEGLS
jgi:hypothetical protein